ncbi:MAG: nucleotidyl transferase [Gemmatimonadales bacterium]|nr:MAG: nucleotidyl transferase [Gemmatimonadales bacterium]
MKAVIPLAGRGTRLRPHTLTTPKPLVHVAGRPVMSYILDDLIDLGVTEVIFVIGYLGDVVKEYVAREYPTLTAHYVVQDVQDGTAGAVKLAEPFADGGELLILFVDTLFDADLSLARALDPEWAGVIWAKEVEDYQRFGVIVTDEHGAMTRIVEKPTEPVSKLANIGLYYIRDTDLLFRGIDHVLAAGLASTGEYYLTDAFQYMVDHGARIRTAPVGGWYDCGKVDALLETNAHLVATSRGGISPDAVVEGTEIVEPVRVEAGARLRGGTVGPNVTIEAGAVLEDAEVRHSIVGANARLVGVRLTDSMIGAEAHLEGIEGRVNVAEYAEIVVT